MFFRIINGGSPPPPPPGRCGHGLDPSLGRGRPGAAGCEQHPWPHPSMKGAPLPPHDNHQCPQTLPRGRTQAEPPRGRPLASPGKSGRSNPSLPSRANTFIPFPFQVWAGRAAVRSWQRAPPGVSRGGSRKEALDSAVLGAARPCRLSRAASTGTPRPRPRPDPRPDPAHLLRARPARNARGTARGYTAPGRAQVSPGARRPGATGSHPGPPRRRGPRASPGPLLPPARAPAPLTHAAPPPPPPPHARPGRTRQCACAPRGRELQVPGAAGVALGAPVPLGRRVESQRHQRAGGVSAGRRSFLPGGRCAQRLASP